MKRVLQVPRYLRYMDDLVLFGRRRGEVQRWIDGCVAWLRRERALEVRVKGGGPLSTRGTHRFLGYTCSRGVRRVSGPTLRRAASRVAKATRDGAGEAAVEAAATGLRTALPGFVL